MRITMDSLELWNDENENVTLSTYFNGLIKNKNIAVKSYVETVFDQKRIAISVYRDGIFYDYFLIPIWDETGFLNYRQSVVDTIKYLRTL